APHLQIEIFQNILQCSVLISFAGWRGIREIFKPRTIRVWRDSSTKAQPCFLSHRPEFARLHYPTVTIYGYSVKQGCKGLSARAHDRTLKLSRTIADIDKSHAVSAKH